MRALHSVIRYHLYNVAEAARRWSKSIDHARNEMPANAEAGTVAEI
jgi:hypothetical protein